MTLDRIAFDFKVEKTRKTRRFRAMAVGHDVSYEEPDSKQPEDSIENKKLAFPDSPSNVFR